MKPREEPKGHENAAQKNEVEEMLAMSNILKEGTESYNVSLSEWLS
jgi:hypothetical protein